MFSVTIARDARASIQASVPVLPNVFGMMLLAL